MITIYSKIESIKTVLDKELDINILPNSNVPKEDYRIFVRLNIELDIYIKSSLNENILKKLEHITNGWKINILIYNTQEVENDPFLEHIFSENTNKVDFGLKYRFHSLLDNQIFNKQEKLPPIVTFYSYKGGLGRTTTMTSYALHLAQTHGSRVVIIDFDLEAPGYLNFFNLSQNTELLSGEKNGVVEYLIDNRFADKQLELSNYYVELGNKFNESEEIKDYVGQGAVFVFPAGNLTSVNNRTDYLNALSRLDFANENEIINSLNQLFIQIKNDNNIKADIILLDSRTGFNDIYGLIALNLSDIVVGFFGSSEQTRPGLEFLLEKIEKQPEKEILLINSILPTDQKDYHYKNFVFFLKQLACDEIIPLPLTRTPELEGIGIYDNNEVYSFKEDKLISLISNKKIPDLENIFNTLNNFKKIKDIFPKQNELSNDSNELRKIILSNLKKDLPISPTFAEDVNIDAKKFYYRESMNQIFDKNKFVIQGFKGTGKTYLYKALKDNKLAEIQEELKERAIKQGVITKTDKFVFIDIISEKGKDDSKLFDFSSLKISEIKDISYFFKYFWIVYTWNSIFLDIKKLNYEYISPLQDKIINISPDLPTVIRFTELINNQNYLIIIEDDLSKLEKYLEKNNFNLVVLYDQLDNLIKTENWGIVVSPLIDYWWNNLNKFKRLNPKIFIRTDLFNKLKGTNTERLRNNLITIEWSKDEIYAYFFKLVFSNQESKKAFFKYLKNQKNKEIDIIKLDKQLIDNNNQLPIELPSILYERENQKILMPLMTVFFGNDVRAKQSLGHPYKWFYLNLSNADQESISLRPFINLIAGSIDSAMRNNFISPIIHYSSYANPENRYKTVEAHFRDLTREDDNKDLIKIIEYLKEWGKRDEENINYKQIFLTKKEMYNFLEEVFNYYKNDLESKSIEDLKNLLAANGIIHRNPSANGDIYYFAQLYKYWIGLKARKNDYFNQRIDNNKLNTKIIKK